MKRKISPFKLGLFVLLGLAVVLGGLFWIGLSKVFRGFNTYAVVFEFSVEGLQKGAPVKYLGVQTGHVKEVDIAADDRYILVLIRIESDFQVDESMVVQLTSAGIAGQSYLALQRAPEMKIQPPDLPFEVKHPVIPSRPGGMARMKNRAKDILKELEQADIPGLVRQWRQTAQELSGAVAGEDIRRTLDNLRAASADLQTILQGLSGAGKPEDWRGVFTDIADTAESLRQSTETLSAQLEALPPGAFADLNQRMEDVMTTAEEAVSSFDKESEQMLAVFEKSVLEVNQLLSEMQRLINSLRQSPGEILEQRRSVEPFAR